MFCVGRDRADLPRSDLHNPNELLWQGWGTFLNDRD